MARDPAAVARAALAASDRIKATARNRGTDARKLIVRYVLERWLHRLTLTGYHSYFVLKGGMIMPLLGDESRPTEDVDGNFDEEMDPAAVAAMVREVCAADPAQEDGIVFDTDLMRIDEIRDGIIPGVRASFGARLETLPRPTPVRIKLDLTYGDAITPTAVLAALPQSVKGLDPVTLAVYPWATVVAEKLHAMQRHGALNTRLKDYYDLALISRSVALDGRDASAAVSATFTRWGGVPLAEQVGLSAAFAKARAPDWNRFVGKGADLKLRTGDLASVIAEISAFVGPVLAAAAAGESLDAEWVPGGGWEPNLSPGPRAY